MAQNAPAVPIVENTPVRRTGRPRKPNMRFADDEMDDTVRKIVTGVSTPPDGSKKKGSGRDGSGGRKDGSGQRKGSCDKDKKASVDKGKHDLGYCDLREAAIVISGMERVLADSAGAAIMAATSATTEDDKVPKNIDETRSSSNNSNSSSSSRRSTRGQPYTSPLKDGDLLKDSGVSFTLVPAKQGKIKKKFTLDMLKGRKFPVKGNMVVLDMKQSSIVTVKPKQIKDLIQLESKSCKVSIDPVKLETEPVKLDTGPVKLKATKLMCEESESEESSLSGSVLKKVYKIGNIDCIGKSSDKKMPLLFSESEFSDQPQTSLNEANKIIEKLVSNLGNIDNENKMECDISFDQVKPKRRGRPKKERSPDRAEELPEETGNEGVQEKMEIHTQQVDSDKEELKHGKSSDIETTSDKEKPSFVSTVEDEETDFNVTSKRERDIELKKMDEENKKVHSIDSPKLKKRKASDDSVSETDKQKDHKDLGYKKNTDSTVKEEQNTVEIDTKVLLNENDMKKEVKKKELQIERPKEKIEKDIMKQEESKVSKSSFSQEKNLQAKDKDNVATVPTTDVIKESLLNKKSLQVTSEKSQITVKKEIKKESESIPSGSKRKFEGKESSNSERERTISGSSSPKKLKVENNDKTPEKAQSLFTDTDKEMEVPKDMMGIAHIMSFLRRPAPVTPQKQDKLIESPRKIEVKKEATKKSEENLVKKNEGKEIIKKTEIDCIAKKSPKKEIIKKTEEKDEVIKKLEENNEVLKKSEEVKEETKRVEEAEQKRGVLKIPEEKKEVLKKPEEKKVFIKKPEEKIDLSKKVIVKKPEEKTVVLKKHEEKTVVLKKPEEKTVVLKKPEEKTVVLKRPEVKKGVLKKPEEKKVVLKKPEEKKVVLKKPEENKVALKKPEENKVSLKKPEEKIEVTKKPHEKRQVLKKPEELKTVLQKPEEKEGAKKDNLKITEERNKSPCKSEIKIEEAKKTEEIKREEIEKKKGESPLKLLMTDIKSEKISPKKAESPLSALMHECKGEKRKKEETKKIVEKKKDDEKKVEEGTKVEEKVLEIKSKKFKLEDEVGQTCDELKSKDEATTEQDLSIIDGQKNELEKKQIQIKNEKVKELKKENIEMSSEKNNENIVDKVKIEEIKRSDSLILEEKIKNRKGSRSTSNSPCRLVNRSRKLSKEKEVSPLDVLMKNVKESDTESDGSLTERSLKKAGRMSMILTKEKCLIKEKIVTREKSIDSDSDNNSKKGKKKDKEEQIDNVSPKKENTNKKYLHIEKCIDNVITAAVVEDSPKKEVIISKSIDNVTNAAGAEHSTKKVVEKKKENSIDKEVNVSKSENILPKKEVKKDDEKPKKVQEKRKSVDRKKLEEKSKTEDRKNDDEKKEEKSKMEVEKKKINEERRKKDDKRKLEEEKKRSEDEKRRKGEDMEEEKKKVEEEKRKKTDDKKKVETHNANINEGTKSSPAQRKMSRSASNSPSRPTPRSARKLYKDEDIKKKLEEEKKKEDERISVKEESGVDEKKKKDDKKKEAESKVDTSHKNIKDKNVQNKDELAMEIDEVENVDIKKESISENTESTKETLDNKENMVPKEEREVKSEVIEPELTEEERLEEERKKKLEEEERDKRNKAVVEVRMKSFVHLAENLYISERKKTKRNKELRRMTCDCYLTKEEVATGEVGCGEDCLNRLLMVECGSRCKTKEHCSNKRFQTRSNADVEVFNADEKGCGVRARTDIDAGTFLMEYIGEVFDMKEFKRRRREYAKDGGAHFYFMSLRSDELIDATRKGNLSRFVNHSCDPNAETQKWTVNGDLRIGFFSKNFIAAGDEITFDYRMERYGREPQKCYCGTALCRGWLGEAPDQKTKEEKEEDKKREERERRRQERKAFDDMDKMEEKDEEKERRDRRKPILDDMDLEDEIEKLGCVGLRNRQDTLNLSRLMVRAMDEQSRLALLSLLREGEPACRRLFLDYHGLRVLWSWMADIGSQQDSAKLKMEILTTLGELPITNKTQLTDSRVMSYVEKWSQQTASQNTVTTMSTSTTTPASLATKKTSYISEDSDTEVEGNGNSSNGEGRSNSSTDDSSSLDSSDAAAPSKEPRTDECKVDDDNSDSNLSLPTKSSSLSSSSGSSDSLEKQEDRELLHNVVDTTLKLLDQWKNLKEAFRIPKKERIELMKEHERQVDQDYQEFLVRDTTLDRGKSRSSTPSYYSSRIIRRSPDRDRDRDRHRSRRNNNNNNNNNNDNDNNTDSPNLSKEERRQQFALKVQQEEEEASIRKEEEAAQRKMQEEMWQLHVERCRLLCQDPYTSPILDPTCRYFWDPKENNWQPYSGPVPELDLKGHSGHNSPSEGDSNCSSPLGPPSHQPLPGNLAPDSDPAPPTGTNTNTCLGNKVDLLNPANIPLPGEISLLPQCSPSQRPSTPGGTTSSPTGPTVVAAIPLPGEASLMPSPTTPTTPGTPVSPGLPFITSFAAGLPPPGSTAGIDEGLPPPSPVGPITITLPPKWKIARDPRGHVYFYHVKTRISQWEIPTMEQHRMLEQTLNLHQDSDSDSVSSDDSDSSDSSDSEEFSSDEEDDEEDVEVTVMKPDDHTVDEKMIRCTKGRKKHSAALVQERVISPILEIDRETARQERHKAKERAREEARQERRGMRQERLFDQVDMQQQTYEEERQRRDEKKNKNRHKDRVKMKERLSYALNDNSERGRKIKDNFKAEVAMFIVSVLNPYRRSDCLQGKINSIEDFKYLGKKLTHFVMVKELRQLPNMESLEFSESVKNKTRDFINKYMMKFGSVFKRDPNDTKDYN